MFQNVWDWLYEDGCFLREWLFDPPYDGPSFGCLLERYIDNSELLDLSGPMVVPVGDGEMRFVLRKR